MTVNRWLTQGVVLGCLLGTACSTPAVRAYSGAKLQKDEVSVLVADRSASPGGVSVVIRRVNGIDTVRKAPPLIEVAPGPQVVQVKIVRGGTSLDGVAEARSFSTLSFDTVAGRKYRIQGTLEDGLGKAWVIGENDAPVHMQPPASQP